MNFNNNLIFQKVSNLFEKHNYDGAKNYFDEILNSNNDGINILFNLGLKYAENNYLKESIIIFNFLQKININDVRIPFNLGLLYTLDNNAKDALIAYKNAIKIQPNDVQTLINISSILNDIKNYALALEYSEKAIEINQNYCEAWLNKGISLNNLKFFEASVDAYDKSISLNPNYFEAWSNKSLPLNSLKLHKDAIVACNKAINLKPDFAEAWSNKGNTLIELKQYEEAVIHFDKAINLKPDFAEAWSNKGNALLELKQYDKAVIHFDKAINLKPDFAEAWSNKGNALLELKQYDEAVIHLDKAIYLKPDFAEVWSNMGVALNCIKKHNESAKSFFRALELKPDGDYLLGQAHHQMMLECNWENFEAITEELFEKLRKGKKCAEPFGFQAISESNELSQKCAILFSEDKFPEAENLSKNKKYNHKKIRIGYLCGEFRKHATSVLLARIWELHDKSKFEIYAFDNGWNDGSDYRKRIEKAFNKIYSITQLSDLDAARLIQFNEIDILVNLNGFFGLARQGIFAYKPAPVQVNYLGFPGTIGIDYIDYIIADNIVIPHEDKKYFSEKVAYLSNSYQANDCKRKISKNIYLRRDFGLSEKQFVFANFNNNYKITPNIFSVWMQILNSVDDSILWLLRDNTQAEENLRKEALLRGIDPNRLVFTERLELEEHLARHALADLFLDTSPYNAHTTASDALWAGLPVLTLQGKTFPGRVTASLLKALNVPELITNTLDSYKLKAINLAKNQSELKKIKSRIKRNKLSTSLFNSDLFTKSLESIYIKMYMMNQEDIPKTDIYQ